MGSEFLINFPGDSDVWTTVWETLTNENELVNMKKWAQGHGAAGRHLVSQMHWKEDNDIHLGGLTEEYLMQCQGRTSQLGRCGIAYNGESVWNDYEDMPWAEDQSRSGFNWVT